MCWYCKSSQDGKERCEYRVRLGKNNHEKETTQRCKLLSDFFLYTEDRSYAIMTCKPVSATGTRVEGIECGTVQTAAQALSCASPSSRSVSAHAIKVDGRRGRLRSKNGYLTEPVVQLWIWPYMQLTIYSHTIVYAYMDIVPERPPRSIHPSITCGYSYNIKSLAELCYTACSTMILNRH